MRRHQRTPWRIELRWLLGIVLWMLAASIAGMAAFLERLRAL
jgi:hypothetical protein